MPVGCGRSEPDLASHDDGGRPAAFGNFGFPAHIFGLAPLRGDAIGRALGELGCMTVAGGTAKFWPILSGEEG